MSGNIKDTSNPNALVAITTSDSGSAFATTYFKKFFNGVDEHYDTWWIFADNENQVYSAMDKVPDRCFTVLAGHGTTQTLTLGNTRNETYTIDVSDNELKDHLGNSNPGEVILLASCSTGWGKESLGETIATITGKKVIAPKRSTSGDELRVINWVPFDANWKTPEDTYKSK